MEKLHKSDTGLISEDEDLYTTTTLCYLPLHLTILPRILMS